MGTLRVCGLIRNHVMDTKIMRKANGSVDHLTKRTIIAFKESRPKLVSNMMTQIASSTPK